jgi:hypothetical protein
MNYTPQQFNEMAARADGYTVFNDGSGRIYSDDGHWAHVDLDYYNDLNQLMPLAWKNKVNVYMFASKWIAGTPDTEIDIKAYESNNKDPIQAIRDCLWSIWQEGNTNE